MAGSRRPPARAVDGDTLSSQRVMKIAQFREELRAFLRQSDQVARRWGLTPQRYSLLLAIKGAPDGRERLNFTDLAQRLHLSANTVTELVARAEDAGLLRRERSTDDQRVVYVSLTHEGERRLRGALLENDQIRGELARAFEALSESFRLALHPPRRRR